MLLVTNKFIRNEFNYYVVFNKFYFVIILLAILVLFIGVYGNTVAAQNNNKPSLWTFYFDNDALAGSDADQGYSGGVSLSLSTMGEDHFQLSLAPVLQKLDSMFMNRNNQALQFNTIATGLTVFTPDSINSGLALTNERPYASLLYFSNTRIEINTMQKNSTTSSFTVGLLGLELTGVLQNLLHERIGARKVQGWDNQISVGGEPTFRYSVAKQRVLVSRYSHHYFDYELSDTTKFNIGYLTDVLWGVSVRVGQLHSSWWSFNPELEDYTEKSVATDQLRFNKKSEFYLWAGINLRLRLYNAFLEGQFRDSAVRYDRSDLNSMILEYWIGMSIQFNDGFGSSYFIRKQTAEIKTGLASRDLVWGGIIINQSF